MEKKLILKLKLNKEDKDSLRLKTEDDECNVLYTKGTDNALLRLLQLMDLDEQEIEKLEQITKLDNLLTLIKQGFTIRLDEVKDHIRFIAFKGNASITFGVSKEQGIAKVLMEAEDWAEEFLKEANNTKTIKGKGINALLDTIDEIYNSI